MRFVSIVPMSIEPDLKSERLLMVVPTLGERPDYLRQTLDSIQDQKGFPIDICIIYPSSSAITAELAKEYNAISVEDPGGISAAVNAGIAQAKDEHIYIGWIGDDDLLRPDSVAAGVKQLEKDPNAVLAYGYCDYIDHKGNLLFTNKAGRLAPWLMTWGPNLVPCPGLVFRKSALLEAGEFDETNKYSMDLDMLLRLRKIGKFLNTKKTLAAFRWHATSITVANRSAAQEEIAKVKQKHLSQPFKTLAPLWEPLVRKASALAAKRVSKIAAKQS